MPINRVKDGPSCRGCGLPNYEGLCPVCRGDYQEAVYEGLWREPEQRQPGERSDDAE